MSRGLSSMLENAGPTLFLAVAVLVGGVGYGLYERHQNPAEASSPAAAEATSVAPAASEADK